MVHTTVKFVGLFDANCTKADHCVNNVETFCLIKLSSRYMHTQQSHHKLGSHRTSLHQHILHSNRKDDLLDRTDGCPDPSG